MGEVEGGGWKGRGRLLWRSTTREDAEGEAPRLFLKGYVNNTCLVAHTSDEVENLLLHVTITIELQATFPEFTPNKPGRF